MVERRLIIVQRKERDAAGNKVPRKPHLINHTQYTQYWLCMWALKYVAHIQSGFTDRGARLYLSSELQKSKSRKNLQTRKS